MAAQRTEELAVMFDTEKPLALTPQAQRIDDPAYSTSWLETAHAPVSGVNAGDG